MLEERGPTLLIDSRLLVSGQVERTTSYEKGFPVQQARVDGGDWKPDPQAMIQQSVLSVVADNRKRVMQNLGPADRARMDQYFTSVREAELQMAAELQRPEIQAKVTIPDAPAEMVCNNALPNLRATLHPPHWPS